MTLTFVKVIYMVSDNRPRAYLQICRISNLYPKYSKSYTTKRLFSQKIDL